MVSRLRRIRGASEQRAKRTYRYAERVAELVTKKSPKAVRKSGLVPDSSTATEEALQLFKNDNLPGDDLVLPIVYCRRSIREL
jgi:hypothetical protein